MVGGSVLESTENVETAPFSVQPIVLLSSFSMETRKPELK